MGENRMDPSKLPGNIAIVGKSLSLLATDAIREMIIKGECPTGARLLEMEFADALGVSRAVVREAFKCLEGEGLLLRQPNKCTVVVSFTPKDVDDLYQLRIAIELCCLETAIRNDYVDCAELSESSRLIKENFSQTPDTNQFNWIQEDLNFHELLVTQSRNTYAIKVWKTIKNQIETALYKAFSKEPEVFNMSGNYAHEEIIKAIEKRDLKNAQEMLRSHIYIGGQNVVRNI